MVGTSPANEREEYKVEVLARLDELERHASHLKRELSVVRTLAAHYWPVEPAPTPRLVLAR